MGDTLTTYDKFLKRPFRDFLENTIPRGSKLTNMIETRGKKLTVGGQLNSGATLYWSNQTALAWRGQALSEGGDLANAGYISAENFTTGLTHRSHTLEYTGHLKASGTKRDFAYNAKKVFTRLVKALRDEVAYTQNIFDCNNSTEALGTVSSVATNVVTITSGTTMNWFQRGMHVDIYDSVGGSSQLSGMPANGRLTDVDVAARTITLTAASGAAAADVVILYGYASQSVPAGIQALISATGTVQGVNRATAGNGWAKSWRINGGGAALDWELVQQVVDRVQQNAPNNETNEVFFTDHETRRWFFKAMEGQFRWNTTSQHQSPSHGIDTIKFHTGDRLVEVQADNYAPPGNLYYLRMGDWGCAHPEGVSPSGRWNDDDGRILARSAGSSTSYADKWQATWIVRRENTVDDFQSQAYLDNYISP